MYHIDQYRKDLNTEQSLLNRLAQLDETKAVVEEQLREVRNRISRNKTIPYQDYEKMSVEAASK